MKGHSRLALINPETYSSMTSACSAFMHPTVWRISQGLSPRAHQWYVAVNGREGYYFTAGYQFLSCESAKEFQTSPGTKLFPEAY